MGKIKGWTKRIDKENLIVWYNDYKSDRFKMMIVERRSTEGPIIAFKWVVELSIHGGNIPSEIKTIAKKGSRKEAKGVAVDYMRRHPNG